MEPNPQTKYEPHSSSRWISDLASFMNYRGIFKSVGEETDKASEGKLC